MYCTQYAYWPERDSKNKDIHYTAQLIYVYYYINVKFISFENKKKIKY